MTMRHHTAVLLLVVGCSGQSASRSELAASCADAAATLLLPRRDAGGPVCLAIGDAGCPVSPPTDALPDPASWGCYADKDCDVFPTLPICDRRHCGAAQATVTCVANTPSLEGLPSPEVTHVFTGTNGTFADRCDENGNLLAFQCETTVPPCDPAAKQIPNGCDFSSLIFTGRVIPNQDSTTVDCEGRCRDGRCDGRCPQQGDEITLIGVETGGHVVIRNNTDGRSYSCTSDPDFNYAINFDCARSPAGQSGYISGGPGGDGFCTGKDWGSIGVIVDGVQTTPPRLDQTCTYVSCRIIPAMSCTL
jgi:hypothetical protein